MAAMLNWNAHKITVDGGVERTGVSVVVRNNVVTVRSRGEVLDQRDQVTGVMPVAGAANMRTITFADGSSWTVEKRKGCGCRG